MSEKKDLPRWLKVAGAGVALLIGLGTLGLVMPWEAASHAELKAVETTAKECCTEMQKQQAVVEGKLDTIIEMLKE